MSVLASVLFVALIEYIRCRSWHAVCFFLACVVGWFHVQFLLQKQLPEALELATLRGHFEVVSAPVIKPNGIAFKAKPVSLMCEKPSKRWPADKHLYHSGCENLAHWKNTVLLTAYKAKPSNSKPSNSKFSKSKPSKSKFSKSEHFNANKAKPLFKFESHARLEQPDFVSLRVGDFIHAKVRLRRPRGMVNRGLFDYQAWLLSQGVYAKGYILPSTLTVDKKQRWGFETLRAYFNKRFDSADNITFRPLFKALLLGDKTEITPEQWQVLQQTGTLHLMAISGLHIGLAAWLGFILSQLFIKLHVRILWRVSGRFYWCSFFRLLPYGVSILSAYCYAGLAGFSVPTMRALIMVCTVNLCFIFARRVSLYRIFALAALIIVLLDPFVFLATGFWLSFGAVFILLLVYKPDTSYVHYDGVLGRLYAAKRYFFLLNRMQWVLFLGLLFPVLFLTGELSWVASFANIFMVPLVSFVIVPILFLIAALFFVAPATANNVLSFADILMHFAWTILKQLTLLQNMLNQFVPLTTLPIWATVLGCIAVVCFFIFKPVSIRLMILCWVTTLILSRPNSLPYFTLSVLDVGQGLSVVMTHKNDTWVYDTGAYLSPTFDMGKNIIAPSLKHHHIHHIDTLVISHSDNDHKGGAASLMNMLPVKRLLVSGADVDLTLQELLPNNTDNIKQTKARYVHPQPQIHMCMRHIPFMQIPPNRHVASKLNITPVKLHVTPLWPINSQKYSGLLASTNNRSCVLLVEMKGLRILLTGDIDRKVEQVLVDLGLPKVDILIAAHHGSNTSSSRAFIEALAPSAVIFSSGYKNKYGHPHPLVVNKYTQRNIKTFNTALDGEVYLLYDINKPYHVDQIKTARGQANPLH